MWRPQTRLGPANQVAATQLFNRMRAELSNVATSHLIPNPRKAIIQTSSSALLVTKEVKKVDMIYRKLSPGINARVTIRG
jgi:hypothetical protein